MKKILVISPYFAPENMVASIRFTKIAKYLKRKGYDVTVICSDNMAVDKHDRILEDDAKEIDRIYRIPPVAINRRMKAVYAGVSKKKDTPAKTVSPQKKTQSKPSLLARLLSGRLYKKFLDRWIYYMELLQGRSLKKFVKKHRGEFENYDCVISTYGPFSSHILGSYMKKKGMCQLWIADFRDVVYDSVDAKNRVGKKRKKRMAALCQKADAITAITEEMLKALDEYSLQFKGKSIRQKGYRVSNGFDENDRNYLSDATQPSTLEFAYCGTIYYGQSNVLRDPRPFFKAVRELVDEDRIPSDRIKIHYAGACADAFVKFADEFGLSDCVVDHAFVERIESLNIQRTSDVILSLSWNSKKDKGIMTGKIYEAFLVERNVLCLVSGDEANSDLGEMIRLCKVGTVWEEAAEKTTDDLKESIYQMYLQKNDAGKLEYRGDMEEIRKYSYRNLTDQFIEIIEQQGGR